MKIIPSITGVLCLEFESRIELTLSMCRIQEFYESPFENIKGNYFTMEEFIGAYYADGHKESYFDYWEGFNIPKTSLLQFFLEFNEHLTMREQKIHDVFMGGDFDYLIAVDVKSDPTTIDHELSHARYALDAEYYGNCKKIVSGISDDLYQRLLSDLLLGDYPDDNEILDDEIHAYLKTSTEEELINVFSNCTLDELKPYINQLRAFP